MKKVKFFFFLALLLFPALTFAEEEMELVAETKKYYKTVTVLSNSKEMLRAGLGEVSSFTTEITKEEYDSVDVDEITSSNNLERGIINQTVETTYKLLSTEMYKRSNYYFRYKTTLTWKLIPSTRSYDIIGIGFLANVKPSATYFQEDYCRSSSECYTNTSYYEYVGTNGVGAMFSVPTGTLTSLSQYLEFDVGKNTTNSITYQLAVGDYSHATSTISYNNAKKYSVDTSGIRLNTAIESYYDSISSADSTWTGTW